MVVILTPIVLMVVGIPNHTYIAIIFWDKLYTVTSVRFFLPMLGSTTKPNLKNEVMTS